MNNKWHVVLNMAGDPTNQTFRHHEYCIRGADAAGKTHGWVWKTYDSDMVYARVYLSDKVIDFRCGLGQLGFENAAMRVCNALGLSYVPLPRYETALEDARSDARDEERQAKEQRMAQSQRMAN
jgi:hypothetical protein